MGSGVRAAVTASKASPAAPGTAGGATAPTDDAALPQR